MLKIIYTFCSKTNAVLDPRNKPCMTKQFALWCRLYLKVIMAVFLPMVKQAQAKRIQWKVTIYKKVK